MAFLAWEVRQSRLAISGAIIEMRNASNTAMRKARTVAAGIDKVQNSAEEMQSATKRARELWEKVR